MFHTSDGIIEGLCDRNGHRYDKNGVRQYGGDRIKSGVIPQEMWLNLQAAAGMNNKKIFILNEYVAATEQDSDRD